VNRYNNLHSQVSLLENVTAAARSAGMRALDRRQSRPPLLIPLDDPEKQPYPVGVDLRHW
jgi:hypothetical protein